MREKSRFPTNQSRVIQVTGFTKISKLIHFYLVLHSLSIDLNELIVL